MIQDTLFRIETAAKALRTSDSKKKAELVALVGQLRKELEDLSRTQEGLAASVRGFEASHPKLTETIDELCRLLSGIGI